MSTQMSQSEVTTHPGTDEHDETNPIAASAAMPLTVMKHIVPLPNGYDRKRKNSTDTATSSVVEGDEDEDEEDEESKEKKNRARSKLIAFWKSVAARRQSRPSEKRRRSTVIDDDDDEVSISIQAHIPGSWPAVGQDDFASELDADARVIGPSGSEYFFAHLHDDMSEDEAEYFKDFPDSSENVEYDYCIVEPDREQSEHEHDGKRDEDPTLDDGFQLIPRPLPV
ncbi:hypothetical protein V1512DRAFT_251873 [Lipomyces arxii]|uniref:uncharacterized protein n=1 Tax=Lipomyces arxii TaxID=56418 RepID=UPI0034CE6A04